MKKTLLIRLLFLNLSISAQINFFNNTIIDNSYCIGTVNDVYTLDFDNDGDLDVISSSEGFIVWQENLDGLGNFGNIQLISDQIKAITSISIADVDGDGDMDVVSSSHDYRQSGVATYNGIIAWHENLGNGTFALHIVAENLSSADYVKAGDVDGDGDLDIVANTNSGHLAWYKNTNGLGNFSTAITITTTLAIIKSFDIADADGDGDNDIAVTSSSTVNNYMRVGLLKNTNGQGSFSAFQLLRNEPAEEDYPIVTKVLFQDIDNDGDKDIVFSANFKLIVMVNSVSGTYVANAVYTSGLRDRFYDLSLKDMDNDGDLDLVAAVTVSHNIRLIWFENDGTPYSTSHVIENFNSGNSINSFKIDDIDGDGEFDVVVGNSSSTNLVWYKSFVTMKALGRLCSYPSEFQVADLDNDGDLDFITNISESRALVWYENIDGMGTHGLQKVISFSHNFSGYKLGDIDGDGIIDIVTDGKWFKNDGNANFTANTYPDYYDANDSMVFIEDVDNDGHNDIIAVDNTSNGNVVMGWYKNTDGLGNFGTRQSIITILNNNINKIVFADIDGDGDKDIVFSGSTLGIIKNLDGNGTFSSTFQRVYLYGCSDIFCVDIDNDGHLDILGKTENSYNGVGWFKNFDGLGNFGNNPQIINSSVSRVFPADMDNDGDLDIVTNYMNNTAWMENLNGLGAFGQPKILVQNPETNHTNNVADINNDGRLDILYASSWGKNTVAWYKNNGLSLNKITGTVKLDLNNDGCDIADNPMANVKVIAQGNDGNASYSTFTASNGYYQIYVEEPGDYTTSVATTLPNYFTVAPNSHDSNFEGIGNMQEADFCVTANRTVNDLEVTIYATSEARPGFKSSYVVVYRNKGTTQLSGNVKLQYDRAKLSLSTSNPAVDSQTANELTYNFIDLNPFESRSVNVVFQIFAPPIVNLGEIISFVGTVNPVTADAVPEDNVFHLNETVIGSYDPNDITVLEGESITVDEIDNYLHYVIRFQNTGTASAINVVVTNTLDDNLDWNTLQIGAISHNNYISIKNGNKVSFVFNGIFLPNSTAYEELSHGYIAYKIKPKSTSVAGDLFNNEAQIYFDYNTAIHTNKVTTEVFMPLNKPDFKDSKVSLYPNPTNGKIHLTANFEVKSITVYNIYGQEILGNQNNLEIDISAFSSGMYFINIENADGKIITKKVIKK